MRKLRKSAESIRTHRNQIEIHQNHIKILDKPYSSIVYSQRADRKKKSTMAPRPTITVGIQPQIAMYTLILGSICGFGECYMSHFIQYENRGLVFLIDVTEMKMNAICIYISDRR